MGIIRSGYAALAQASAAASALTPTFIQVGDYQYNYDSTYTPSAPIGRPRISFFVWLNSKGEKLYTKHSWIAPSLRKSTRYPLAVGVAVYSLPDGKTMPEETGQLVDYIGYQKLTVQTETV